MSPKKNHPLKQNQELLRSTLFWFAVLICIALPFINGFILQTVVLNISGNIVYANLAPTLKTIQSIIDVANTYAVVAILASAIAYFGAKKAIGTVILGISYSFISFLSSMLAYVFSGAKNYSYALASLGINALVTAVIYVIVVITVSKVRSVKIAKHNEAVPTLDNRIIGKDGVFPYIYGSAGVFAAFKFISAIVIMISEFLDPSLGLPINLKEWMYWVTEILKVVIYAAGGYLICLGAFHLSKYYLKHFSSSKKSNT